MKRHISIAELRHPRVAKRLLNEIRSFEEGRYMHRLLAIRFVGEGLTYADAAELLAESPQTVAGWVRSYRQKGLDGLREEKLPGVHCLTNAQVSRIARLLHRPPKAAGFGASRWNPQMLAAWVEQRYRIRTSIAVCRTLLRQLGTL